MKWRIKDLTFNLSLTRQGGNCIGIVKLSDVVGVLSDLSFNLRDEDTVATLKSYGAEGLIRSPPPQIDASRFVGCR